MRARMAPGPGLGIVLALLAGAGLGACALDGPSVPPDAVRMESEVLVQQRDAYSSFDEPARLVIRDAGAWNQLWPQIAGTASTPPGVDFERDMVVVAAMGVRSSGGYDITVQGVFENADGVYVQILKSAPESGCATTQALTSPVTVVAVPRREATVFWVERSRTTDC